MTTAIKILGLILYVFMAWVAISQPLTLQANICTGVLVALALVHLLECWLFRDAIFRASGSTAWHMLNVFLYGILHMMILKQQELSEPEAQELQEGAA